jgi:hypothetical protein
MAERDELFDDLRAAWSALPPPEDVLERPDPLTRAVLGWMEGAWRELAVPRIPRLPRSRPWWRRGSPLLRVAAALLITSLAGLALWWGSGASPSGPGHGARPRTSQPDAAGAPIRVAAATRERLELASGSVRLVLVVPEPLEDLEPMENHP